MIKEPAAERTSEVDSAGTGPATGPDRPKPAYAAMHARRCKEALKVIYELNDLYPNFPEKYTTVVHQLFQDYSTHVLLRLINPELLDSLEEADHAELNEVLKIAIDAESRGQAVRGKKLNIRFRMRCVILMCLWREGFEALTPPDKIPNALTVSEIYSNSRASNKFSKDEGEDGDHEMNALLAALGEETEPPKLPRPAEKPPRPIAQRGPRPIGTNRQVIDVDDEEPDGRKRQRDEPTTLRNLCGVAWEFKHLERAKHVGYYFDTTVLADVQLTWCFSNGFFGTNTYKFTHVFDLSLANNLVLLNSEYLLAWLMTIPETDPLYSVDVQQITDEDPNYATSLHRWCATSKKWATTINNKVLQIRTWPRGLELWRAAASALQLMAHELRSSTDMRAYISQCQAIALGHTAFGIFQDRLEKLLSAFVERGPEPGQDKMHMETKIRRLQDFLAGNNKLVLELKAKKK